jgi:hypothetical protein
MATPVNSSPVNSNAFKVVENVSFAKDFDQFLLQFSAIYQKLAMSANAKDIGNYENVEILNGQQYFGATPQQKVSVYRKCFTLGAIPVGGNSTFAHGVDVIARITRLYGTCITNVPDDRPIPFLDVGVITNQISIVRNGLNIIVTNGATAPAIVSGQVVMEYLKN